ncbi:MAG: peptidase G2 autoproteolytic cleavage domain-containing protein, partial [Pseudomonadota bacterium]
VDYPAGANSFVIEESWSPALTSELGSGWADLLGESLLSQEQFIVVDTLTELESLSGSGPEDIVFLIGQSSAGDVPARMARWVAGNQSANVSLDTQQGIWVAPTTDPTGASGAWKLEDSVITPAMFGAAGDGSTDDTAVFSALEAIFSGFSVNLQGLTYLVTTIPTSNVYYNGEWRIGSVNYQAYFDPDGTGFSESEGNDASTGEVDAGVAGTVVPSIAGRSTPRTLTVIGSRNCRSEFVRATNIASIHSLARGNVSGNYSSRLSIAAAPQSVNIGCEEGEVYGFRGVNAAAHYSQSEQDSGANLATRYCTSSGKASANIASNASHAGAGQNARLTCTVVGGAVDSISIDVGGEGYSAGYAIIVYDRSGAGTGADFSVAAVDGAGAITSLTKNSGGSNYSSKVEAVVDCPGDYSANVAATNDCITSAEAAGNYSSNDCRASGVRSANMASDDCDASGQTSANIASSVSGADGQLSATIACSAGQADNALSVALSGNNVQATADGAVVAGRRTINNTTRSFAMGNSASGSASTANRTIHMFFETGNIDATGTISGSVTFTDYAEYFENLSEGVIPLGTIVSLVGRRVKPWVKGEEMLGVVSATALIRAGNSPFTWSGRYLTGEFGEPLFEEIPDPDWQEHVPDPDWAPFGDESEIDRPMMRNPAPQGTVRVMQENPNYDPSIINVPRSERPAEWSCIGLLGQLHVRLPQHVQVGEQFAGKLRVMEIRRPWNGQYQVGFCLLA